MFTNFNKYIYKLGFGVYLEVNQFLKSEKAEEQRKAMDFYNRTYYKKLVGLEGIDQAIKDKLKQ